MPGFRLDFPWPFVWTAAANQHAGAELFVYENNTTTPVTLWADRDCTIGLSNPIVSAAGFFMPAYVASAQLLSMTLKNTAGAQIGGCHADDISPYQDSLIASPLNQPLDATLTALAALVTPTNAYLRSTGTDTFTMDSYATVLANIAATPTTRTISAGVGLTGGGDFTANRSLAVDFATKEEIRAATADQVIGTDEAWAAMEAVTLSDAATIAVDMALGINFTVTLGGNRTLGQPTNVKQGQSGFIRIVQDGTGSRTLGYHADWKFAGGVDPTLSTPLNTVDVLFYQVLAPNFIYATLVKALS